MRTFSAAESQTLLARRGIAEWLSADLVGDLPTIVGIDHAFSFPLRYFETHQLMPNWTTFLDDFHKHWPTDRENIYVDFIRNGLHGHGELRSGVPARLRLTEEWTATAKSVFRFDQVSKAGY